MPNQSDARLPIDADANAIMALAPSTAAVVATATGTTGSVALPAGIVVEFATLTAVHFRFGTSSGVTTSSADRLLPAGAVVAYAVPIIGNVRATHVAFMKCSGATDGLVSIGALV
jgi:hypothetical protein